MSEGGGLFGTEPIDWFNGGLFDSADVLPLIVVEIELVQRVSQLDWSQVEPGGPCSCLVQGISRSRLR